MATLSVSPSETTKQSNVGSADSTSHRARVWVCGGLRGGHINVFVLPPSCWAKQLDAKPGVDMKKYLFCLLV
jgi:hypothetical protein